MADRIGLQVKDSKVSTRFYRTARTPAFIDAGR